ncbi:hypothetical protein EB118_13035 [bacterium]|nr:hypothetical protein [bacterium]
MGTIKPGVNYIYERVDGVVYAREFGAPPNTRFPIGWDYVPADDNFSDWNRDDGQPSEQQEWYDYDPDC